MAIRYDAELNQDIKRTVRNFNKKVARLQKAERELIPDKVYVRDLKKYSRRKDLLRQLKEMKRFSQRGAEDIITTKGGVKITKWAFETLKRDRPASVSKLVHEAKRLKSKVTTYDVTRKGALNLVEDRIKLLSKDINSLSQRDFDIVQANVNNILNKDQKLEQFYENFYQILFSEFALAKSTQKNVRNIESMLSKLRPEEILRIAKEDPEIKALLDYSPTKGNYISQKRMKESLEEIEQHLPSIIKDVLGKEIRV